MTILAIIMSSLALLAAISSVVLVMDERKRSQERNAALLHLADSNRVSAQALEKRIQALEDGVMPDYEKAKAAANAVNDFNAGISGILGFDPLDALRAQRQQAHGGDST